MSGLRAGWSGLRRPHFIMTMSTSINTPLLRRHASPPYRFIPGELHQIFSFSTRTCHAWCFAESGFHFNSQLSKTSGDIYEASSRLSRGAQNISSTFGNFSVLLGNLIKYADGNEPTVIATVTHSWLGETPLIRSETERTSKITPLLADSVLSWSHSVQSSGKITL